MNSDLYPVSKPTLTSASLLCMMLYRSFSLQVYDRHSLGSALKISYCLYYATSLAQNTSQFYQSVS